MTDTLGAVAGERATPAPQGFGAHGGTTLSQFGAEKFTTRSREAIEAAQLSATTAGNTQTEPIHLLVALLRDQEGTAATWSPRPASTSPRSPRAPRPR